MIHATPDSGQVRLAHSRNGFRLAVNSDAEAAHVARQLIASRDPSGCPQPSPRADND